MKKLDRYIFFNMLKISISAMAMITFLLVIIELFINFQRYTSFTFPQTMVLLGLRVPNFLSLIAGPAVLFSTTFFVSSLYSNNEFISLLSAGVSYIRIIRSIVILGIIYTLFFFAFNERVKNPCDIKYDDKKNEYSSQGNTYKNDNRNIALSDNNNNITVRAGSYKDDVKVLENVDVIVFNKENKLEKKVHADTATWDAESKVWKLKNAQTFNYNSETMIMKSSFLEEETINSFTMSPSFFRSKGEDIRTMKLSQTKEYLTSLKKIKQDTYNEKATEFYTRISQSIIIFVMMIVSLSINLKSKRNAMMFSLISALALAVAYYAINMATTLMAKKGAMNPLFAISFPIIVILSYSAFMMSKVST